MCLFFIFNWFMKDGWLDLVLVIKCDFKFDNINILKIGVFCLIKGVKVLFFICFCFCYVYEGVYGGWKKLLIFRVGVRGYGRFLCEYYVFLVV